MSDLAAFLLARIAEDEALARGASHEHALAHDHFGWSSVDFNGYETAAHGDRWDPARVLAECEAKRRIVEATQRYLDPHPGRPCTNEDDEYEPCHLHIEVQMGNISPSPVLQLLALPYADHPDYRPEWAATESGIPDRA